MEFIALACVILLVLKLQNSLYTRYGLKHIDYHCYFSTDQATEGDEIELVEELSNRKWLPLPWFKSEITTSKWLDFAGAQSNISDQMRLVPSFFMLKSFSKVVRRWKVTCLKRGEYEITHAFLVSTDLLGYSSLSMPGKVSGRLLVLPRPLGENELTVSPRYLSGELIVRRHLVEDPFVISGVREYNSSDPMNRIHWAATAKEGRIMVYNNESTSRQSVAVILNMQSREFEGNELVQKSLAELAIRVSAALFDKTLAIGMPLRFFVNTSLSGKRETITSNEYWGASHIENLLQILARLPLNSTEDFPTYLGDLLHQVTSTDIFIVTCYLNDRMLDFARLKEAAGSTVKFLLLGDPPSTLDYSAAQVFLLNKLPQEVRYEF